jgi:hypothetical protein
MPKFELLITVSGYTRGYVEAVDEAEAREKFDRGDWEETRPRLDYELEEITEETK